MRRAIPIIILLITGLAFAQPSPSVTVRVRLFSQEQPSQIRVTTSAGAVTVLDARDMKAPFRSDGAITIQRGTKAAVRVSYPVEVSARNGALMILAKLPMEDYIAAVLAGESSGFRSDESMKAMALAARTYAAHFLNRHESEGYNFCDSTHCQDLRLSAVTNRFRQAVEATSHEVLEYDGQPIASYYHADCGGVTEARASYLPQMNDAFCTVKGRHSWSTELSASDVQSAIGLRDVYNVEVIERTASGRAQRVRISGAETRVMGAEPFRLAVGRTLGWTKIRSDLYEVRRAGARFVFEGHGSGHGIGLCQAGAAVMGGKGHTYKEILAYYFPGATIARMR